MKIYISFVIISLLCQLKEHTSLKKSKGLGNTGLEREWLQKQEGVLLKEED